MRCESEAVMARSDVAWLIPTRGVREIIRGDAV